MKSIAEITSELSKWRGYLVQYQSLENVSGGLDAVRNRIANLEIMLAERC